MSQFTKKQLVFSLFWTLLLTVSCGKFGSPTGFGGSPVGRSTGACKPDAKKRCDDIKTQVGTPVPLDSSNNDSTSVPAIKEYQAVFAVRNMSCTFCHATILSSVFTDFGLGAGNEVTPRVAFLDLLHLKNTSTSGNVSYGPTIINGSMLVPSQPIPMAQDLVASDSQWNCAVAYSGSQPIAKTMTSVSIVDSIKKCMSNIFVTGNKGSDGNYTPTTTTADIKAVKTLKINPVYEVSVIRGLVDASKLSSLGLATTTGSSISGVSGSVNSGFKVENTTITCEGAAVFDAPLFLNNVTFSTKTGCRIYNTRSIFSFGELKVEGSDKSNLQLLSAAYIGLDMPVTQACNPVHCAVSEGNALRHRLVTVNSGRHQKFSIDINQKGLTNVSQNDLNKENQEIMYQLIMDDANKVGIPTTLSGGGAIAYNHIAVAAPLVFSASTGMFTGTVIAEQFLGNIGKTKFTYSDRFTSQALYPELKNPMVELE